MSTLQEYFRTDWDAMTGSDWVGMAISLVMFILMAGVYIWVFLPGNRAGFEKNRDFVMRDDRALRRGAKNGKK